MKKMDPHENEKAVNSEIDRVKPDIVVTYAVHGISGFHDHLVTHAVVKRVFCEYKKEGKSYPRRLAFYTRQGEVYTKGAFRLEASAEDGIKFTGWGREGDRKKFHQALDVK